jgi:hypothetical protein
VDSRSGGGRELRGVVPLELPEPILEVFRAEV